MSNRSPRTQRPPVLSTGHGHPYGDDHEKPLAHAGLHRGPARRRGLSTGNTPVDVGQHATDHCSFAIGLIVGNAVDAAIGNPGVSGRGVRNRSARVRKQGRRATGGVEQYPARAVHVTFGTGHGFGDFASSQGRGNRTGEMTDSPRRGAESNDDLRLARSCPFSGAVLHADGTSSDRACRSRRRYSMVSDSSLLAAGRALRWIVPASRGRRQHPCSCPHSSLCRAVNCWIG